MAWALFVMIEVVAVVIGQFLPGLDVAPGGNPDAAADDVDFAVRIAAVIDESSRIPADTAVDVVVVVERKDIDVLLLQFRLGFGLGKLRPDILDDTFATSNVSACEAPGAVDAGWLEGDEGMLG